jgi:microcystin-dependent protein
MSQPYIGEIRMGAWNFAPSGWALCNGSLMAISQNNALFSLIGTFYGGDGVNTFQLPNLSGRLPVHQGSSLGTSYVIGQTGGAESVTLTQNQIPGHNHALEATASGAASTDPTGQTFADSNVDVYVPPTSPASMNNPTTTTGGGQPHSNFMPYLCITFAIALFGIFPTQS